jgi:hypothetical protein
VTAFRLFGRVVMIGTPKEAGQLMAACVQSASIAQNSTDPVAEELYQGYRNLGLDIVRAQTLNELAAGREFDELMAVFEGHRERMAKASVGGEG